MKNIMSAIKNELDLRLCCVQLVDCHYCSDPGIYFKLYEVYFILDLKIVFLNKIQIKIYFCNIYIVNNFIIINFQYIIF